MEGHKDIKVSICIPAYNSEKTIGESIDSAKSQKYPLKEILVLDDGSTDGTAQVARDRGCRVILGGINSGIGRALVRLMEEAYGKYVVYLCADDLFTNDMVVSDIVKIFDNDRGIGVIGRYFYQFMNGHPGAIAVSRDRNIITQSCCPSGMAFRKKYDLVPSNEIFIEVPSIVAQYLPDYRWTMLEYDVVAARIHPGGNTGTKTEYYNGSQIANWVKFVGPSFRFNEGFIQIKNRAPHLLWQEIKMAWNLTPGVRKEPSFYLFAGIALLVPGCILRPLSKFYRHRITRRKCKIIERP